VDEKLAIQPFAKLFHAAGEDWDFFLERVEWWMIITTQVLWDFIDSNHITVVVDNEGGDVQLIS